jgi:hypothetical protein
MFKENEVDDVDMNNDMLMSSVDFIFSLTLKKYNKTRKSFDFDRLLDIVANEIISQELFNGIFKDNLALLKKELVSTSRKPKVKEVENKVDVNNDIDTEEKTGLLPIIDHEPNPAPLPIAKETVAEPDALDEKSEREVQQIDNIDTDTDIDIDTTHIDEAPKQIIINDLETKNQDQQTNDTNNLNPISDTSIKNAESQTPVMHLDYYRKQAISLATKITNKFNIGKVIKQIDTGCGFILIDTIDETKNDFEHWGVWWLLLGYSHAADLLNPIFMEVIHECKIENDDLLNLYLKVSLTDPEGTNKCLDVISELSGLYEFRSPFLQSAKDKMVAHIWQDITALEAACYQIMRLSTTVQDDFTINTLWDTGLTNEYE